MSLGKKIISGIVQATGLSAYRTKFASIRGTFATDNPIATTRPMKNQVKLMDFRLGRDVPRRIQSLKNWVGSGQDWIAERFYLDPDTMSTSSSKNWSNLRFSSIFLDLTRFHFSVEMVFAPRSLQLVGIREL